MGPRGDPDPVKSPEWVRAVAGIDSYYAKMELQLSGKMYLAGGITYADIAFYMAQFFAARHTVPMTALYPNLWAWRIRMSERAAVKQVTGTMIAYLRRNNMYVPDFLEA